MTVTITSLEDSIGKLRRQLNTQISTRNSIATELDQLRTQHTPDTGRIDQLRSQMAGIDSTRIELEEQLRTLETVQREEEDYQVQARETRAGATRPYGAAKTNDRSRTYTERNQETFLQDLLGWSTGQLRSDGIQRLEAHEQEARAAGQMSERATSTTSFAGIVPPQYLIDQYAAIARAGRPTANVVQHFALPDTGMSLVVPRGTTGVSAAVQATQNSAVSNTDAAITDLTIPIVTIAGQQDVSRQAIERGAGVDQIVFGDLVAAYAQTLNQQVLAGTGSGGQMLGILNTAGITQMAAFTAAADVPVFFRRLAGAINAVQTGRYFAPNVIIMHPRRWNWLTMQLDSSNRPLVTPGASGPMNALGVTAEPVDTNSSVPVGVMFGLPVITDPSIPTSVGTGPEDQVIVARREDLLLWEDSGAPFTLKFDQPLANQLTVKLVAYGYAAFTAARYPLATAIIGGNSAAGFGLVAPTF